MLRPNKWHADVKGYAIKKVIKIAAIIVGLFFERRISAFRYFVEKNKNILQDWFTQAIKDRR
jgi:uncharacterized membrane protein (Fun14 family)